MMMMQQGLNGREHSKEEEKTTATKRRRSLSLRLDEEEGELDEAGSLSRIDRSSVNKTQTFVGRKRVDPFCPDDVPLPREGERPMTAITTIGSTRSFESGEGSLRRSTGRSKSVSPFSLSTTAVAAGGKVNSTSQPRRPNQGLPQPTGLSRGPGVPRDLPWYDLVTIGKGTYGEVYKARPGPERAGTQSTWVALKRLISHDDDWGFPITSLRERRILLSLNHKNLVRLFEMYQASPTAQDVYMVFEFIDLDLEILIRSPAVKDLTTPRIKSLFQQLLEGTEYMHSNKIMHRDLKPSNLLISKDGTLKICDFGLARTYRQGFNYTWPVITLHYRPPELILGWRRYTPAIDMWSCGAIFAELLTRTIALPGRNEADYLNRLWQLCGPPPPQDAALLKHYANQKVLYDLCPNWPDVSPSTPGVPQKRIIKQTFEKRDPLAVPLLESLLTLIPSRRCSAGAAADFDYFWQGAMPLEGDALRLEYDVSLVRTAYDDYMRRHHAH